jgi:acyl carrier protein
MDHRAEVRGLLQGVLTRKGDTESLADDVSLFLSGRLQSLDAVEVAVLLEERFGIDFAAIGFDQEKIDSVDAIVQLVDEFAAE